MSNPLNGMFMGGEGNRGNWTNFDILLSRSIKGLFFSLLSLFIILFNFEYSQHTLEHTQNKLLLTQLKNELICERMEEQLDLAIQIKVKRSQIITHHSI